MRSSWLLALVLGGAPLACQTEQKVPIPAPEGELQLPKAPRPRETATPETPLSEPAKHAKEPEKPALSRFVRPPQSDRRTLAHILEPTARIGVYLGLPAGWRNDDPSYLLFFPQGKDPKPPARAVAMTLFEEGLVEPNKARVLRRGAKPTGLRDARWSAWKLEPVGRSGYPAAIATGTGLSVRSAEGPRAALAVIVDIPGAPALGFVGSWSVSEPEHEATMGEMLRAIERCQVEVGRGCVTAQERKRASL